MRNGFVVIFASAWLALAACENDFKLQEIPTEDPPQVSVVSTDGAIVVHWSAVDEVFEYAVFVSTTGEFAGDRVEPCPASPCVVPDLTPGQLYYVRVASIVDEAEPETGEDFLERIGDIESLSIRAGFPGQPRGPFVWAGTAVLTESVFNSVELEGMWFEDDLAPSAEHVCYTYWENGSDEILDPCTVANLAASDSAVLYGSCYLSECHPVFEVQADDGRYGQAFTRVVVP